MLITRLLSPLVFLVALAAATISGGAMAADIKIFDGLEPGQKVIVVRGEIEPGDDHRFYELAQQADRAVVYLESPGGAVEAGLSIGAEIAIRGFTTLVLDGDGCHSICAVIWVSGVRRYMSPKANISVHAAYRVTANANGEEDASESGMANASIGAYLNQLGLSLSAIKYFTTSSPEEPLLPITPEIAQVLDIDVYIQDDDQVIAPSERPTPRRITQQATDYVGMVANCSELFGVDPTFWEVQAKQTLESGHDLFGAEAFVPLLPEYTYSVKEDVEQQGFVRWCIATERNLRNDGQPTGIKGPSFDCSKSGTSTEFAVCSSEELWVLDRAMSNLYFLFKRGKNGSRSAEFLDGQRDWLQRRDTCNANVSCLTERYSSRLFDFGF